MTLTELFELLEEEVSHNLIGTITNEGLGIKWEYDSFNHEFEIDESENEHLERVHYDDLEHIKDYVDLDEFNVSEPTIEDTYISFYIEE